MTKKTAPDILRIAVAQLNPTVGDVAGNLAKAREARADAARQGADIVLCGPVVQREAAQQGKSLKDHYTHLLVHAALHAQGYEHETNQRDALEMESLEILLLGALGVANPY